jgi:hypothetical protein
MSGQSAQPSFQSLLRADLLLVAQAGFAATAALILVANGGGWGEYPVRYIVTGIVGGAALFFGFMRYRGFLWLFSEGEEVRAAITRTAQRVSENSTSDFHKNEPEINNELSYSFVFRGKTHEGSANIWGYAGTTLDSSLLKEGDEIILLVDPGRPERHIIRNRYLPGATSLLASVPAGGDAVREREARKADEIAIQKFEEGRKAKS